MVVDRVAATRSCAEWLVCVHLLGVLGRLLRHRRQLGLIRVLVAKRPERLGAG